MASSLLGSLTVQNSQHILSAFDQQILAQLYSYQYFARTARKKTNNSSAPSAI